MLDTKTDKVVTVVPAAKRLDLSLCLLGIQPHVRLDRVSRYLTMTITIDILPTELRAHIVGYVAPDEVTPHTPRNLEDLHALCLASKALNEVATPALYRAFSTEETADHLGPLLRSISENTQLAKHIKYIFIHHWYFHSADVALSSESIAALQAAAPLLASVLRTKSMSSALENGSFEARLVLLLAVATQVNSLGIVLAKPAPLDPIDLRWKERDEAGVLVPEFMRLLATISKDQPTSKALSKLAHVEIDRWFNVDEYTDTTVAQALLALPQLRTCSISSLVTRANSQDLRYAGQISRITQLHLSKCNLSNSSLVALLSSCIALEEVCIRWVGCSPDEAETADLAPWKVDVDFVELASTLAKHAKTLKILVLDTLSSGIAFVEQSASFGPFQGFERLESLEIDDSVIFGATLASAGKVLASVDELESALENFFPPNIEKFTLHNRRDFRTFAPILCILNKLLPKSIALVSASFILDESSVSKDCRGFLNAVRQGWFPYMRTEDHPKFAHEVMVYECDIRTSPAFFELLAANVSSLLADPESFQKDEAVKEWKQKFDQQFGVVSEEEPGEDSEESENEQEDEQHDELELEV